MNGSDVGLETLLELDGSVLEQEGGFWIKIEAREVPASQHALHGIRYSLTLHDRFGIRVLQNRSQSKQGGRMQCPMPRGRVAKQTIVPDSWRSLDGVPQTDSVRRLSALSI